MNKIALLLFTGLFAVSCSTSADKDEKNNEDENSTELGESYGEYKVDPEKAISVEEMLAQFEGQAEEMEFTIEAELNEICSKAGCWVNIDKGNGETFMVRFKDHFTIPPETEVGTGAYLHGRAFWDTVSVDLQRHFIEDANGTEEEQMAITEPKATIGFEGYGITLKK